MLAVEKLQGAADVVIGIPSYNNARTIGHVVQAAQAGLAKYYPQLKAVIINSDGGSTDGTPDIARDASIVDRETLVASQSLRTRHRISAPYHGVPGKAAALRTVFAAADLLQARAVVVLDPEIASVTPESVAALARPALRGEADFVSPVYVRHPLDGPLVTQVVRPLFRTAYGIALQEPLAGEFGCSGPFAARCLEAPAWESDDLRLAIDLWISGVAAGDGFRVTETVLGPRRLTSRPRPAVAALVPQVLDALFTCLRLQEKAWTSAPRADAGRCTAPPTDPTDPPPTVDAAGYAALFREGLSALGAMLEPVFRPPTLEGLRAAAAPDRAVEIPDALWASAVVELAAAHRHAAISRDHLVRAAVPLYLGRVASFAAEAAGLEPRGAAERLEGLCLQFERSRGDLVSLWTAPSR